MLAASLWRSLDVAPPGAHVVQFYRAPGFLRDAVAAWLAGSLARGGGAVLIGTPHHAALVRGGLRAAGVDADAAVADGRLLIVDADATMARFLVRGSPDRGRFLGAVEDLAGEVRARLPGGRGEVRAWGEMVDLLRQRGNLAAAKDLEALWNEAIAREDLQLLCSYGVDNFEAVRQHALFDALTESHTHLLPEENDGALHAAVARAMEDVFGQDAPRVWATVSARAPPRLAMPAGQAALVGLLHVAPQLGARVLTRTREHFAREHPRA